jgi:hypothetical protein
MLVLALLLAGLLLGICWCCRLDQATILLLWVLL